MITTDTFRCPGADGERGIFVRAWLPERAPRAVLQLVHGVAEHSGRYEELGRFLAGHGVAAYAQDLPGHGRTAREGERGWFAEKGGWRLAARDVYALRQELGRRHPGVPFFLLGHSMGSFLVRTCLIDWPGTVDGAILSGTGQEAAPLVAVGRALAACLCALRGTRRPSPFLQKLSMGSYNRAFRPNRTPCDWISRDPAQVDAYLADPLCGGVSTAGLFRDMLGGIAYIGRRENAARMDPDTPVLLLSGEQDPVGAMGKGVRKVERLFRRAGARDVTVRLYPGGRHEMFHDPESDTVRADLLAWVERRI